MDNVEKVNLLHAFVTSRLDCGNAVLFGLPVTQLKRLQRILHIAARILTLSPPSQHITPLLQQLHWLPLKNRVEFKLLLLAFKCLHGLAPAYLANLLTPYTPSRALRSASSNLLHVPSTCTKTYGDRAFSVAAPRLWNSLPQKLRQMDDINHFKSAIKTFLFKTAYNL